MISSYKLYLSYLKDRRDRASKGKNWSCTTIYRSGKKRLVFVGCSHKDGHDKEFVGFLDYVFKIMKPGSVLIEYDNAHINNVSGLYRSMNKRYFSDKELAFYLGDKYSIDVFGMDIPISDNIKIFADRKMNGSIELAFFSWFVILIQQKYSKILSKKHYDKIQKFDAEKELFLNDISGWGWLSPLGRWLRRLCKNKGINLYDCFEVIIFDMYNKYVKKTKGMEAVKEALANSDFLSPNKVLSNDITKKLLLWNASREAKMINTCISQLKVHDSVVAIAGNSHVIRAREALFREFSKNFGKAEHLYLNKRLLKKFSKNGNYSNLIK